MRRPRYPKLKNKKPKDIDTYRPMRLLISKSVFDILERYSYETSISMSRLVNYAVDNELETMKPFTYECDLPDTYTEYQYAGLASKLFDWLRNFPSGVGIDTLILSRRDILESELKSDMLGAILELKEKGMVTVKSRYINDTIRVIPTPESLGKVKIDDKPKKRWASKTIDIDPNGVEIREDKGGLDSETIKLNKYREKNK